MDREAVLPYEHKHIRLVLKGYNKNFVIDGVINHIFSDAIQFVTIQRTSVIHLSQILEIRPWEVR